MSTSVPGTLVSIGDLVRLGGDLVMDFTVDRGLLADGTVGVTEAAKFTGLGRTYLYALMECGELRYVKAGKRRLIPRAALTQMLAERLVDPTEESTATF
jgi:excisionase family DNA binding protein